MIAQTPNIINKRILQIAVPSIISNITVPLLGLIDVTIVGHLGSAAYIGAIAVGGMLFNIIYWIFGFLRMGTSGMTSQAYGKHDMDEVIRLLLRSVGVGLLIAIILVALQYPIRKLAFTFIQTTEEVELLATLYFQICIWGAPAMLGLYGFAGWHAEFAFPDVHCHYTKHCEHRCKPLLCLFVPHESCRGSPGDTYSPVCRILYGIIIMEAILWQIERTYCLAGDIEKRSYATFLSGEPGHFPTNPLPGYCHSVLYLRRSSTGRGCIGSQHFANAAIYSFFLYNGWLCLFR